MIQHFISRQFLTFLLTGAAAAFVNFLSRIVYSYWVSFTPAIILSYITGMIVAFVLAKKFVFKNSNQPFRRSAIFFTVVNIAGLIQVWIVSILVLHYVLPALKINTYTEEIAHAIGILIPTFTSFLGHKYFSFR